jgi:hypothetical protein
VNVIAAETRKTRHRLVWLLSVVVVAGGLLAALDAVEDSPFAAQRRTRSTRKPTAKPSQAKEPLMTQWTEFNRLWEMTGAAYTQHREQVLANTPDLDARIADLRKLPEWQAQTLARILTGWREHRDLYRTVLLEVHAIDYAAEQKKVGSISAVWNKFAGRAQKQYGDAILPLCWEVLLKYHTEWPPWKLMTFLHMQSVLPDALSVEPILTLMDNQPHEELLALAGRALRYLPAQAVRPAVTAHLKAVEAKAQQSTTDEQQTRLLRQVLQTVLKRLK